MSHDKYHFVLTTSLFSCCQGNGRVHTYHAWHRWPSRIH